MTRQKYVFVTFEAGGNVAPVLAAARRMVEEGHDVRVLSEPCLEPAIRDVGARFSSFSRFFHRTDRSEEIFFDWEASSPPAALKRSLERVILGPADRVADDVKAELEREPCDALVVDWLMPGAVVVGQARRIPTAVLFHCVSMLPAPGRPPGPLLPAQGPLGRLRDRVVWGMFRALVGRFLPRLNALRAREGLAPLDDVLQQYTVADRILHQTSRAFDFVPTQQPENEVYVGPVLDDPDWLKTAEWESPFDPGDERPLVVVSMSSTFQAQQALLQAAIDALGTLDVRGLVTLGPAMATGDFSAPANVRLVESAPHALVFPHASAFVSHCGHGSVMRALAGGVPIVGLPMGRDQDANAARIVHRGLGLKPKKTREGIAKAVERMLGEASFRQAATRMQRAIACDVADDRLRAELLALPRPASLAAE